MWITVWIAAYEYFPKPESKPVQGLNTLRPDLREKEKERPSDFPLAVWAFESLVLNLERFATFNKIKDLFSSSVDFLKKDIFCKLKLVSWI